MGTFKLGKMTFGSLFKKPETVLYPFESKPQPVGLKGHIVVDVDLCILCGMCDRNCTTGCITVDKKEHYWEINPFGCIQCGYCTTVCPKKCLHMDPNYWAASPAKEIEHFDVPVQEKASTAKTKPSKEQQEAPKESEPAKLTPEEATPKAAQNNSDNSPQLSPQLNRDAQLDALIAQLNPEKAKIVESALANR